MPELLLELFSEEIPARMQRQAAEQLKKTFMDRLSKEGLLVEAVRVFATPRRLTLVIDGLPVEQPDVSEERKGPRVDAREKAIEGFLRSTGLTLDQCQTREDKKGSFYVAVIEKKGQQTAAFLSTFIPEVIRGFNWPKSMRWGAGELRWVRPLHNVLCVFDGEVVPFEVDGLASGNFTCGHRFMAPGTISVRRFDDYCDKLESAHVILDLDQRSRMIAEDAKTLTFAEGFELVEDVDLLEENAGLVEWPVPMVGTIDDQFVRPVEDGGLPPEVLTTAMKKHQMYFSVRDPKTGRLAPRFVMVSNLVAEDGGAQIKAGNERVLRARLSDAKFFWDQDCKQPLEARVDKLKEIVFHAKLGTVYDKVQRVETLARHLAPLVGAKADDCARAARLAKADLTTGMVGEFADLQGLMGRYYAVQDGEGADIADAIKEHYAPLGPNDDCPSQPVSIAVALADKIDTLVAFWAIDEKPTGSSDPYALRRACLGVIRLLLENNIRVSLNTLIAEAYLRQMLEPDIELPESTMNYRLEKIADDANATTNSVLEILKGSNGIFVFESNGLIDELSSYNDSIHDLISDSYSEEFDFKLSEEEIESKWNLWNEILVVAKQIVHVSVLGAAHENESLADLLSREQGNLPHIYESVCYLQEDLFAFFADRLKVYLRDRGIAHQVIDAVFAMEGEQDLVLMVKRMTALNGFLGTADGANLLTAYARASNILRIEEKKDKTSYSGAPKPDLFELDVERELHQTMARVLSEAEQHIADEDFEAAMETMSKLRGPVDVFFDTVKVNVEDVPVRKNRLFLLSQIRSVLESVADFSKLDG